MKGQLCFVALLSCITLPAIGQSNSSSQNTAGQQPAPRSLPLTLIPRSREERERTYRSEHQIRLNVVIVDESDRQVGGLNPNDFTLTDNRQPQKLTSFREVNGSKGIAPANIMLLLDAVNNTSRSIAYEIGEIDRFLGLNQGHLTFPTSLAVLTSSGVRVSQSSLSGAKLSRESRTLFKNIQPYTCENSQETSPFPASGHGDKNIGFSVEKVNDGDCLNKKFVLSLTQLRDLALAQQNTPGRVILIWIGPGWPQLTGPEFQRDTPEIKQNFFDHIVELSRILREAQVTVDAVYSPDMFPKTEGGSMREGPLDEGVPTEDQATASSLALAVIAKQSGGRVLEGRNIAEYIAKCSADAQTYYALSFDSVPSSKPDEYHSLRVQVNRPGVRVFTTASYYGEP